MADTEKSQRAWISHFIGNWQLKARFAIREGTTGEEVKNELVAKLTSRTSGALVDEVRNLLGSYDWSKMEGLDGFLKAYEQFEKKYARVTA